MRRYGPAKATVVDVARVLEVSHGSIYRHFPSKAVLRDAVAERWLHRVSTPLAVIAAEQGAAIERLQRWLERLISLKRRKFSTIRSCLRRIMQSPKRREVVQAHIDELGATRPDHRKRYPAESLRFLQHAAAKAVFNATSGFIQPMLLNGVIRTSMLTLPRYGAMLAGLVVGKLTR